MLTSEVGISWWTDHFDSRLAAAQARMRVTPLPPTVQRYFDQLLDQEERELLGKGSLRERPLRPTTPFSTPSHWITTPTTHGGKPSGITPIGND